VAGLRRHVPALAIEWALEEPERLWREIDGTLCFADISGFTALSEKLAQRGRVGGEELVETLSRIFGGMLERARAQGGELLKFGGDALLLLFKGDNHPLRAAVTALEMQAALREAKKIPTSVGRLKLSMSVGLHSGPICFFLVGAGHRELVLLGRGATRAAEVEGAANAGEIGLSPETASHLPQTAVTTREDGLLLLQRRGLPKLKAMTATLTEAGEQAARGLFPSLLSQALEAGPPEPEHRVACIAFVRFSGTDALLNSQGPDAVAEALQATLTAAQEAFAIEGVSLLAVDIDKDGGKFFLGTGVPYASEDDEGRMLRALRKLMHARPPLPIQAGVNRGHVFAAEVGTHWRAAYSAMGDTTNTAARICSKAPVGEIYAHPQVLAHSRTRFETESAGPFTFKGKKVPQVVYRIGEPLGIKEAATEAELPLVGRARELETLRAAIARLGQGEGSVVSVTGAAGLGKTRLVSAALDEASKDIALLRLRAELNGVSSPYRMLRDPFRAVLGIERAAPEAMRQQLLDMLGRLDPELPPFAALVGDVVQVPIEPSPEVLAIEPRFRPSRTADMLIRVLEKTYQQGEFAIVVDDAQWVDEASAVVLGRLAGAAALHGWILVTSRREGEGGFSTEVGQTVVLEPLSPSETEHLVIHATESTPFRPHDVDLIVRRSAGNPLYAQEIVRAALRVGSVEAVPDSLEAAIASQVDALDPLARRILRYVSVLGRSFARATAGELLGHEGLELDEANLDRLEDFLEPEGEHRLRFRVGLVRKTIYEGLAFRLRARLHRSAGEILERMVADKATVADNLALHFSIAGDQERTWKYALVAADRAARAYANVDAARLYKLALEASRKVGSIPTDDLVRVWTAFGDACKFAGMFDQTLSAYLHASRLVADDPIAHADLLCSRARARERMSAFPAALRELSKARRILRNSDSSAADRVRARLGSLAASIRFRQERFQDAITLGEETVDLSERTQEKPALAQALVITESSRLALGQGTGERLTDALRIYEELGNLSQQAMVQTNLGCGAYLEGRWDKALEWFQAARVSSAKAGNVVEAANAASNVAEILVKRGQIEAAEPILREVIRVMRASGFNDGAAYAEIQLGRIMIRQGRLDQAEELLERVRKEFSAIGQGASALEAAIVQSGGRTQSGDHAGAIRLLDAATSAAGKTARAYLPQLAEARARALCAAGDVVDALSEVERGLEAARSAGMPYEEAMLLHASVDIVSRSNQPPSVDTLARLRQIETGLGVISTPRPQHHRN